jgi:hypothetical protein
MNDKVASFKPAITRIDCEHDEDGALWRVGIVGSNGRIVTIAVRTPSLWRYARFCRAAERRGMFLPPLPHGGWRLKVLKAIQDARKEARSC